MQRHLLSFVVASLAAAFGTSAAETLPYLNPGEDLTTVTVQGHGSKKWSTYKKVAAQGLSFRIDPVNTSTVGDAWLWTPELPIENGKYYEVSTMSCVQTKNGTLEFEVYLCSSPTSTSSKTLVATHTITSGTTFDTYTTYIKGDASKPYVGFHNICKGNYRFFYLDDISVKEIDGTVPGQVTDLTAVNTSLKNVTVSFTLPQKTIVGETLSSISDVVLYRNGVEVKRWGASTPGGKLSFTETVSSLGANEYSVVASFEGRPGQSTSTTVTVGGSQSDYVPTTYSYDKAYGNNYKAPAVYTPGQGITLSWAPLDAGSDADTGEPIPVTYTITRVQDGKVVGDAVAETTVVDSDALSADLALYTYKVKANYSGTSKDLYTSNTVSLHNSVPFDAAITQMAVYEYTYNDGNIDSTSWGFIDKGSDSYRYGASKFFRTRVGKDWLITPGINLEAGKTYRIDVDVNSLNLIPSNVGFGLRLGKSNQADAMTTTLIEDFVLNDMLADTYSGFYTPTENEMVFVGMYGYAPSDDAAYNDLGVSAFSVTEVPAGLPSAVTDIAVSFSKTDARQATISFKAPETDVTGSPLTAITKIEMVKDDAVVKTFDNPAPGELLSAEVTVELGKMSEYTILPYTADGKGLKAKAEVFIIEPPYENEFTSKSDLTGFTVINPDATGYTWAYQAGAARAYPASQYGHDDYLVTPPMHLEGGKFYKVNFTTWLAQVNGGDQTNQLELLLGTAPTIESLTTKVIEPYTITSSSAVLLKEYFTVPETGEYYLAWHATSPASTAEEIYMDNFTISEPIDPSVPNVVTNLTITPDPNGAEKAEISFDLPTINLGGEPLDYTVYKYTIFRDGTSLTNGWPKAGDTQVTYTDSRATTGMHLYTVICYKDNNTAGKEIDDIAFIGVNLPAPVGYVKAVENPELYGEVTISWEAPVNDYQGFKLNTSDLTYTVGRLNTDLITGELSEIIYAEGVTGNELTVQAKTGNDAQEFCRFFVRPATSAGQSPSTVVTRYMAVGEPYTMPFTESFPNSRPANSWMQEAVSVASWGFNTVNPVTKVGPVDSDNGLAMMEAMFADGTARFFTARIKVDGENPVLSFYVYNQTSETTVDENMLIIEVRDEESDYEILASKTIDEWVDGNPGWHKATVDLSALKGRTVYIGFRSICKKYIFTHLDAVRVGENPAADLSALAINVPAVYVGRAHDVTVKVHNNGTETTGEYKVQLLLDGQVLETATETALASGADKEIVFSNILDRAAIGKHRYTAKVVYAPDADLLDNTIEGAEFELKNNDFPKVNDLAASMTSGSTLVTLNWTEPVLPIEATPTTDNLETYEGWRTMLTGGLGDWTLVDYDEGAVGGFQNFEMPNVAYGSQQSFYLMDVTYQNLQADARYTAHSGTKMLVSSYNVDQSYTDDYLISPRLTGDAQTISFWARALSDDYPERFSVLVSSTGTNLKQFTKIASVSSVGGSWTKYEYELPEGTLYFAIEHYNYGSYFFFVDDITYTPEGDETLVLEGYNVYRDNEKLTSAPVSALSWAENLDPAINNATYGVTALYNRGESPVEEVEVNASTVGIINPDAAEVHVYSTESGINVDGAEGQYVTVTSAAGVVYTSFISTGNDFIPLNSGIYLVNVADRTFKIAVR
ncbi:MAG: choice-of-anchor J domain-containing protein [Muribaculaceae bacterium]|nr:choice-of-anchor J domain-containing protein [Muribaculaceae bacterium]